MYHSLLAHKHFMTACRAFLTKHGWKLAAISEQNITFCDKSGNLSLTLFTATPNGMQLNAIIEEGFLCEALSWKIDEEGPTAAIVISTATNEINSVAMRTTEIQAIKVLKGEIMAQMSKDASQAVYFQTVLDRVKRRWVQLLRTLTL